MNKSKFNRILCRKDGYVSNAFAADVGLFIAIFIALAIFFTHQEHPDPVPLRSAFIATGVLFVPIRIIISAHAGLICGGIMFVIYLGLIVLGYQYIGGVIMSLIIIGLLVGTFVLDLLS